MKYSALLINKIEELSEYLTQNTKATAEEVESYYEFCYQLLMERRKLDESQNQRLMDALLEDDLSRLHLALHDIVYEKHMGL